MDRNLIFVWIGNELPLYAHISIELAKKNSGLKVILLCNKANSICQESDETYFIEDFYTRPIELEKNIAKYDYRFRGGFWIYTLERFFVINSFIQQQKIEKCFFAELDNLIFNLEGLGEKLDARNKGLYLQAYRNYGTAGFGYIAKKDTFQKFCNFCIEKTALGLTDMQDIANFCQENAETFTLPFITDLSNDAKELGIFDIASIGQYVFGNDARISNYRTKNRRKFFTNLWNMPMQALSAMNININFSNKSCEALISGNVYPVRNIHIHSKVFDQINNPKRLAYILKTFNQGKSIIVYWDFWKWLVIESKKIIAFCIGYKYWKK
jgi:hypothetical protein